MDPEHKIFEKNMKNIQILVTLLFFSIALNTTAQEKVKSYIGITAGPSFAVGDFSKSEVGSFNNWNNKAGFAKTGVSVEVEGACYFLPKIGIGGAIYYSNHGGFSKEDVSKLGDSYTDAFAVNESTVSTSGNYSSINMMVGPYFSFPISKFTIDFRVMGGLLKSVATPSMIVLLEDQKDTTFKQASSTASSFGWQVGGGFRYALSDKMGLMLKADYFNSDGITIDNQNRKNDAGRLVTKQPMSWMNSSVGISFSLGSK